MRFADSHCHILDPRLLIRAEEIVAHLDADDLDFIVEISAGAKESVDAVKFADGHKNVYCTIGVHPHNLDEFTVGFEAWAKCRSNRKIVGYGECGLDYYHMPHLKDVQKEMFARQIKLAHEMKLPLVVHTRDAFDDTLAILVANKDLVRNGLLIHCFSEGEAAVRRIREHFDPYFAFGGAVTYKGGKLDAAIRAVGLDRMLLETDAPYLTPEPLRGTINEPKNVVFVAKYVAGVLDTSVDNVAKHTLANTRALYRIYK